MFKSWRGKARSFASRAWKRFRIFWLPLSRRRQLIYVALLVVIVGGSVMLTVTVAHKLSAPEKLPTPAQASAENLKNLKNNPPKANATATQKTSYYKQLTVAQADTGNTQGAIAALEKQKAAAPNDMTYYDYIQLANYYHKVNNSTAALAALNDASRVMPKQDNPDRGYSVRIATYSIEQLKEAYK